MIILAYVIIAVVLIVGTIIRLKIYDNKINKAFKTKDYKAIKFLAVKRNLIFGMLIATRKFNDIIFKKIVHMGELFDNNVKPFLINYYNKAYYVDDYFLFIILKNIIVGEPCPTNLNEKKLKLSVQGQQILNVINLYVKGEKEQFLREVATLQVVDINLKTLITYLVLKTDKNFEVSPDLEQSCYYHLLSEVGK